jgi:hypothetical protein
MASDQKAQPSLEDVLKFIDSSPEASLEAFEEIQKRMDKRSPDLPLKIPEKFARFAKALYCRFKYNEDDRRPYDEVEQCQEKCKEVLGIELYSDEWFRGFELQFVDESIGPILVIAKTASWEKHYSTFFKEELLILDKATKKALFTYSKNSGDDDPEYDQHEEFQKDFLKAKLSLETPDDRFAFMCWLVQTSFSNSPHDGLKCNTLEPSDLPRFWVDFERGEKKRKVERGRPFLTMAGRGMW